jgi:hypothetical protein
MIYTITVSYTTEPPNIARNIQKVICETIYSVFGSDFGKVLVPVPDPNPDLL